MKQGKIVQAYKALDKLMQQEIPLPIALKVFEMREKFRPSWEFQILEETKLQEKYSNIDFTTFSVNYKVDDETDKKLKLAELSACEKDIKALSELDRMIELEVLEIPVSAVSIKMAGKDIEALKGIVEFTT